MEGSFSLTLQIVLTVLFGIGAQVLAAYLKLPSIVFLLIFGVTLGNSGLHWIQPANFGAGLEVIVSLSVAIILFEGGLNLGLRELAHVSGSLRNLVTIGTLITLIGGGLAAHWLAEFPWYLAFLYGSLVVVTGPTVVGPLIKQVQVQRSVATLLEGEGVLIDPVGAILAVVVLETIFKTNVSVEADLVEIAMGLLLRLGAGLAIGIGGGWLLSTFLKRASFLSEEISNLVVLAGVWGVFGGAEAIVSESGLMATVAMGIFLNSSALPDNRILRRFKGKLTLLCVSVLFILLAAELSLGSFGALGWGSVLTVLVLMLLIRPLSVALCTTNSTFTWQQKLFVAWIAPRGIVSASVASLFSLLLTEQGINGGEAIKALVFLTIMMTVFIQGLTAKPLAQLLGITDATTTGAVMIGCTPLGRLLARLYEAQGESVVLIDTDAEACQTAIAEGLTAIQTSALDSEALEKAGVGEMGAFMALTRNGEVNLVLAQNTMTEFNPPRVCVVAPDNLPENTPPLKNKGVRVFMDQQTFKTWNQYIKNDQFKLGKTLFKEAGLALQKAHIQALIRSGELLPLILKRAGTLQLAHTDGAVQMGDEIFYLLHDPRPTLLKQLSGGRSLTPLTPEPLAEVEEVPLNPISSVPLSS
ncbi:MAG: cation:proton antiporter [Synechocystis sp.]|nr:cation:proton antiporter [Synechocystis sp.]